MVRPAAIAIIPARGGSKRIEGKNIMDFFGRPMMAWTIDAARESGLFSRIVVSTDDENIAAIAREQGVEVPFLRQSHGDDNAPVSAATAHALEQAEEAFGEHYDAVCQLMPNCPLRTAHDISQAFTSFTARDADFQISCFKFGWMNPWWAVKLGADGHPVPLFPDARAQRSQDLEDLYCPTGAIWIAQARALKASRDFYADGHVFEPLDWTSAVDIDDLEDLAMARAVFLMRQEAGGDG